MAELAAPTAGELDDEPGDAAGVPALHAASTPLTAAAAATTALLQANLHPTLNIINNLPFWEALLKVRSRMSIKTFGARKRLRGRPKVLCDPCGAS